MEPSKHPAIFIIVLIALGIGIGVTISWLLFRPNAIDTGHTLRLTDPNYPLIKPLLACNIDSTTPTKTLDPLQSSLQDAVDRATAAGDITRAGIYIRKLSDGTWTAVHGDDEYSPASLMKIVTLFVYLHDADNDPSVLDRVLVVDPTINTGTQNIIPTSTAIPGKRYTVNELLRYMIVNSDNVATLTLVHNTQNDELNTLLNDLEIPGYLDEENFTISPRHYSRFLRILYNSTLLSEKSSEFALELLAASDYRDALVQGIAPQETTAHKFGERGITNADGSKSYQLHDCGIVYALEPYMLCIMTEGNDLPTLANTIASFTTIVDTFINTY